MLSSSGDNSLRAVFLTNHVTTASLPVVASTSQGTTFKNGDEHE